MIRHASIRRAAATLGAAVTFLAVSAAPTAGLDPEIVARVNGEPITLDRYLRALGELHADSSEASQSVPKKDPTELLQRLVDIELILQEAANIGLDGLPDFGKTVQAFREDTLRGALLDRVARGVPPPDPAEIERRYREKAAEVEVSSLEFSRIEDAQAFFEALRRGDDFVSLGQRLVDEKHARNLLDRGWFRRDAVLPEVARALDALEAGQVSAPLPLERGFAVLKLHGTRLADDPEAREQAEREIYGAKRNQALLDYVDGLRDKYLKTDEELLATLDFEADAKRFDAFLEDDRVVVQVQDGEPIRVRDVARSIKGRMFHGVEQAAKSQRLNKSVGNVLEELTTERIIQLEARKLGLDRDPEFLAEVAEYERAILFGLFVRKVVDPEVQVRPEEIQTHYNEHLSEYMQPEMVRLDAIAFTDAAAAQHALERLNAGADLGWMRANAETQVRAEAIPQELRFDRRLLLAIDGLPEGLIAAIAGAGAGDFRLYTETPERHHLLAVVERVAAKPQPLDDVRERIGQAVFADEREDVVKDWTRRLREASQVEILVDAEGLRNLAMGSPAAP